MNNTSLEFFKSLLDRDAKMIELLLKTDNVEVAPVQSADRPYINIKFVNDVLTVVLRDGNIVSKSPATVEDFQKARNANTELEVFAICITPESYKEKLEAQKLASEIKALSTYKDTLTNHPDFEVSKDSIYVKGINRSLPPLLVQEFANILYRRNPLEDLSDNDEYQGLMRFWMWCCLNPRAEVADKLFNFLKKNSFKITKQGFFTALRNVVTVHGGTEFVQFVSETYNKVKAVWKKSPDKYVVFLQDEGYKLVHTDDLHEEETFMSTTCLDCDGDGGFYNEFCDWEECETCDGTGEVEEYEDQRAVRINHGEKLGNLTELYLDLPNRAENRFTDAHTGTFDIRIGKEVSMNPEDCRWNTDDCGAEGLNSGASL